MDALELDAYYDLTTPTSRVAVSPTGDRVAYTVSEFDPAEDERRNSLFVVPADGGDEPLRLNRASDAGSPKWSPAEGRLAFVASRDEDLALTVGVGGTDGDGSASDEPGSETGGDDDEEGPEDDGPEPQVWLFDLDRGGDARQVTTFDEGVAGFDWGPDGERLVVAARDPTDRQDADGDALADGPVRTETERLQHVQEGAGYLDEVETYLFVVDVDTGEPRRLEDADSGGVAERAAPSPRWSPDGDRIAFLANQRGDADDTYVVDVHTIAPDGSDHAVHTDGNLSCGRPRWDPAGDRLAFAASPADDVYEPTEPYVLERGTGDVRSVAGDLDRTLWYVGGPVWVDDDLVALVGDEGRTRFARFDPDGGDATRLFEEQDEAETLLGFDAAAGTGAAFVASPAEGVDLHALDARALANGEATSPTELTALNDELLDRYDQPECRKLAVESADASVDAWTFYPPGFDPDDPEPRPTVLAIHGGPAAYDQPSFSFDDAAMTTRGYVVCRVNYRGSTSYGSAFSGALRGRWNSIEVDDLLAAVDELVDRGWADPDRLFCTGFSQGGINTAYAITRTDRFAAAAAEHGIYDARAAFGTDDSHVWWGQEFGLPWADGETYDDISSLLDVGAVRTPTLLTAGADDRRCPPEQAEQFYVSLRKRGIDARLVVYEDRHDIGTPDRAVHRLAELLGWFDRFDPATDAVSRDAYDPHGRADVTGGDGDPGTGGSGSDTDTDDDTEVDEARESGTDEADGAGTDET